MHWRKISLHPPVRQTASNYMEKQYSPIFGTLTRHERKDMDKYYYAMPLYSGMCFSDYLSKYANSTSTKSWIAIMLKIALAIQSLHKEGCVHLDIKPNNMIINSQKDFLNLNLIDLDFMTKTGAPTSKVGTKNYMCPELSALKRSEKIPATVAMDLYSLGILLQKIYKILIKKESVSLIKVPLSELIISMVKLKPAERIISINNVLLKLRNIQSILSLQLLPDNPEAKSWACKKPLNKISIPIRTKRSRNPLQNIECPHYNSPVKSPPKRRHVSSSSHSESPTLSVAEFFCPQAASM
jgi:serine/threonine protein kinase